MLLKSFFILLLAAQASIGVDLPLVQDFEDIRRRAESGDTDGRVNLGHM